MKSRVEAFAAQCAPDFIYTTEDSRDLVFTVLEVPGGEDEDLEQVGLVFTEKGTPVRHLFTRWARSQLLSHLGTREKWFYHVSLGVQADELNSRRHVLDERMIRSMRAFDGGEVRLIRGLVSSVYGDIPDTDIMDTFCEMMPNGHALRFQTGKTDRAFYAYIITGEPIALPGTDFRAYPGISVKNSEVGYSSLWLTPFLFFSHLRSFAVLEEECVLRRTHRGKMEEMKAAFEEKLAPLADLWGGFEERIKGLRKVTFSTEDDAVEAMRRAIFACKGSKMFAYRAEQMYRGRKLHTHTGLSIFESVLAYVEEQGDKDKGYDNAAIAGAVLLRLMP